MCLWSDEGDGRSPDVPPSIHPPRKRQLLAPLDPSGFPVLAERPSVLKRIGEDFRIYCNCVPFHLLILARTPPPPPWFFKPKRGRVFVDSYLLPGGKPGLSQSRLWWSPHSLGGQLPLSSFFAKADFINDLPLYARSSFLAGPFRAGGFPQTTSVRDVHPALFPRFLVATFRMGIHGQTLSPVIMDTKSAGRETPQFNTNFNSSTLAFHYQKSSE